MFTSYLMIFPTFLENHFLGAEIFVVKTPTHFMFCLRFMLFPTFLVRVINAK